MFDVIPAAVGVIVAGVLIGIVAHVTEHGHDHAKLQDWLASHITPPSGSNDGDLRWW